MGDQSSTQPIIIKRKKVVQGDGHHGGAWKVAYADFVTAMMAFFLLMWLLNATTEEQRKGIADYFNPTIPVSRISGGGSDGLNGSSMFTEETYAKMGTGGTRNVTVDTPGNAESRAADASTQEVAENLNNLRDELSQDAKHLSEHLMIKMSPEGMVLEVVDSDSSPLFAVGSSNPTPLLMELLTSISGSLGTFQNDLKIVGHTDSLQYRQDNGYDNWNLSTDRANTIRRLLLSQGLMPSRLREVSGRADTDPLAPDNPSASQNRRISIVILTDAGKDELRLSAY
ncbi:flagellar motor protein MotB [Hyphomonas sp.]|jgi:chemotaxis protein MotB|uniref:flagellar motor protein MotB n=1 Tax=Hyphomonas sp. TaxID=87 RepID=UPI0025B91171|nr:flagellar motor protein MotB [Hyphomonas sp.]MEE2922527.1 flagellar motor protein MotB [Pseudomonadota bacterium]